MSNTSPAASGAVQAHAVESGSRPGPDGGRSRHFASASSFNSYLLAMLIAMVLFIISFAFYAVHERKLQAANDVRLKSLILADELRQSSNDLTRLVRTYVITGDVEFKKQFEAVHAIRDGKRPRPAEYGPSYWDFYAVEGSAGHMGPAMPLLEVMRAAGFTKPELAKLAQAKLNSDKLTHLEYEAMALVEQEGADPTQRKARAVEMLHDEAFHRAKFDIMRPIVEFDRMVNARTLDALNSADRQLKYLRLVQGFLGVTLLYLVWRVYRELQVILGCSVSELQQTIAKLGAGDFMSPIHVPPNRLDSVLAWVSDTREKLAKMELLQFRAIVDSSDDAILSKTPDGIITSWNSAAERLFGYTAAEAIGRPMTLLIPEDRLKEEPEILARIARGERVDHFETVRRHKDGTLLHVSVTISPIRDRSGKVVGASKIARDITRAKQAEAEIHRLAFYDSLTGLPNRRLLLERLNHVLQAGRRTRATCAVLFIDLDNFKSLNDTRGHSAGDQLLQEVALRLMGCVRVEDTVARLGGDEFVVLIEMPADAAVQPMAQADVIGRKILERLARPYEPEGGPHHCTPSIGVAIPRAASMDADDLLDQADMAMYQSKSAGRNTIRFFDPQLQEIVDRKAKLDQDLREGLAQRQFALWIQPQVAACGRPYGGEVLLRWNHPSQGCLPPGDFIAQAEANGLIVPIGLWVIESACSLLASWATQPGFHSLSLSVNVSARQLRERRFADDVLGVLQRTGAHPRRLVLELTESALATPVEPVVETMTRLRRHGVRFSIDDFGTGYSSLAQLKRLPIDEVKIDRAFVQDIDSDTNGLAIARMVIALGQSLGFEVVAEGVETEVQQQHLKDLGCSKFQGYLHGRPEPAERFLAELSESHIACGST